MKSKEERVYETLKHKLLDANYTSNSLVEKAEAVRKEDHRYNEKIKKITPYLFEKIAHGDGVAYSLFYVVHQDEVDKLIKQHTSQEFIEFLNSTKFSDADLVYEFFDPKVVYLAKDLVAMETLGDNSDQLTT